MYYNLGNDNKAFLRNLLKEKYNVICINDKDIDIDFERVKKEFIDTFELMFKDKSSFEK